MAVKRKQFLSRLLRISEINEEIVQLSDKSNKQPAYTKRIKLIQMNQCNINLPEQHNPANSQKHNCKILILSKNNYPAVQLVSFRNKTISNENKKEINNLNNQHQPTSPSKFNDNQFKMYFQKKRISNSVDQRKGDVQMISPIHLQSRNHAQSVKEELIYRRKNCQNQSKTVISEDICKKVVEEQIQPQIVDYRSLNSNKQILSESIEEHLLASKQKLSIADHSKYLSEHRSFKSSTHINHLAQQRNLEEERKLKLSMMKSINKNYAKPFNPPPKITAKSYVICEMLQGAELKMIVSFNSKNGQEVASLTKIMTCIITIDLCQKYSINTKDESIVVGKYESNIGGTSANLRQGQIYTIHQLLYGLMLPSGNDASLALAVWCGKKLILTEKEAMSSFKQNIPWPQQMNFIKNKKILSYQSTSNTSIKGEKITKSESVARFIKEMNEKAASLKMNKTKYANPHGLINTNNKSTAFDVAVLSQYAMRNSTFRQIVSSQTFESVIKYIEPTPKAEELSTENDLGLQTQQNENEDDQKQSSTFRLTNDKMGVFKNNKIDRPATANESRPTSPKKLNTISASLIPTQRQMNIIWQNTHKLLHSRPKQYLGIKTGFTNNAGPCLCSCLAIQGRRYLIVVLSCAKMNLRFRETQVLKKWLYKHEGFLKPVKKITLNLTKSIKSISNQCQSQQSYQQFEDDKKEVQD